MFSYALEPDDLQLSDATPKYEDEPIIREITKIIHIQCSWTNRIRDPSLAVIIFQQAAFRRGAVAIPRLVQNSNGNIDDMTDIQVRTDWLPAQSNAEVLLALVDRLQAGIIMEGSRVKYVQPDEEAKEVASWGALRLPGPVLHAPMAVPVQRYMRQPVSSYNGQFAQCPGYLASSFEAATGYCLGPSSSPRDTSVGALHIRQGSATKRAPLAVETPMAVMVTHTPPELNIENAPSKPPRSIEASPKSKPGKERITDARYIAERLCQSGFREWTSFGLDI